MNTHASGSIQRSAHGAMNGAMNDASIPSGEDARKRRSSIQPSTFLRRALMADAAVTLACGALMALGATVLDSLLGLPSTLLLGAGLALFPCAAYLGWLATRANVLRVAIWVPIVLNVVWAADCALVLLGGRFAPSLLGEIFICVQIVTVLAFAELEFIGLRRASSAAH